MKLDINRISTHIIFLLLDSVEFTSTPNTDVNMKFCINNFFFANISKRYYKENISM